MIKILFIIESLISIVFIFIEIRRIFLIEECLISLIERLNFIMIEIVIVLVMRWRNG